MATALLAREIRGWSELKRGGWGLGTRSIDKMSENLCLFEEKVEPLHSVFYLRRQGRSGSIGGAPIRIPPHQFLVVLSRGLALERRGQVAG